MTIEENKQPEAPGPQKRELPEGDDKADLKGKAKRVKTNEEDDRATTPDPDPNRANDRLEEALLARALFGTPSPPLGDVPEEFRSKFSEDRDLEQAAAEAGYYPSPEPFIREGAVARQGYRPEDNMPGPSSQHVPQTDKRPGSPAAEDSERDGDASLADYLEGYRQGRLDVLEEVRQGLAHNSAEYVIDMLMSLYSVEFGQM